jgi:hypothetical protein
MSRQIASLALFVAVMTAQSGLADEFTDVLKEAIDSYEAGEYSAAREDLDYATKLLTGMKSQSLAAYLPKAMPGWERSETEAEGIGAGIGMLSGGTSTAATYSHPDGSLTISLVSDSPMLASVNTMIARLSAATGGRPMRIQRVQFIDNEGDLQGMVDNRILITVSGDASLESKKAYIEAMDMQGMSNF